MTSADIVFVTLPRLELRSPITAPALLKAQVESKGFSARCLDFNLELWHALDSEKFGDLWFDTDLTFRHKERFEVFWNEELRREADKWVGKILAINPRWVGITIFSQRSKWITIKFCQLLKAQIPAIKIVTGGAYSERVSPSLYDKGYVDAYVVGEGENPIVEVLRGNFDAPGINGRAAEQIEDLDTLPIPDYSDFELNRYPQTWSSPKIKDESRMGTNFIYITGSRGCVRKCDFCDVQSLWPKFRYRSGEHIAQEMMEQNSRFGSKRFLFTDSLINGSVRQLKDLSSTLIKYRESGKMGPVKWQGQFIARPERHMKDDVYKLMKEAGCFFVSIGVESGSESVRNDMRKMFDDEALEFTFKTCAKYNIQMAWLLLVGYPTETEKDFRETLKLLETYNWINQKGLVRSVALGPTLDIVPGSPLYHRQKEMGIQWDDAGNWVCGNNTRPVRIRRWLRLKEKCLELGYPIVEKATDHLHMELAEYEKNSRLTTPAWDQFNENPGDMGRV